MKNPTRGELLDIIQVTWKLKEGSRLFLKDVVCFGVPWTAWCQGFYSCDSFGFMRSGRCWKSCNKRTRFGAGCFPRLPWSFSTFGRIFSQAPKKSSGNSHPRPKPAQVPLPGNSVFFFGLGGKQPGWPWKITRMFFFQRDNFLIFFFGGGGLESRIDPKVFLVKMMEFPSLWLVGILGHVVFVLKVWKGWCSIQEKCARDVAGSFATFFFDHLIHQHPEDNWKVESCLFQSPEVFWRINRLPLKR